MKKTILLLLTFILSIQVAYAATYTDTVFLATGSNTKVTVGVDPITVTNVTVTSTSIIFTNLTTTNYLIDQYGGTIITQFDGTGQNYTVDIPNADYLFSATPPTSSQESICNNAVFTFPNFSSYLVLGALAVVMFMILGAVAYMRNVVNGGGEVSGFSFGMFISGIAAVGVAVIIIAVFASLMSNICI